MVFCKLKQILLVTVFKKVLMLNYLIIISRVFNYIFELRNANIKLKVLNNRYNK